MNPDSVDPTALHGNEPAVAATPSPRAAQNTDRELWREREGDFYADSIHVTLGGNIGINCGGHVRVMPIREWFKAAAALDAAFEVLHPSKSTQQAPSGGD